MLVQWPKKDGHPLLDGKERMNRILPEKHFYKEKVFRNFEKCGTPSKGHETESQNHRMLGVGRDLCGSSSPTPLPKQDLLQQAAQDRLNGPLVDPDLGFFCNSHIIQKQAVYDKKLKRKSNFVLFTNMLQVKKHTNRLQNTFKFRKCRLPEKHADRHL